MFRLFTLVLCFFLTGLVIQAQTPFRIDSLPLQSVILNKGWTWHPGDNPDWAKPTFDDRKWQPIDPTQDIDRLPQLKKAGIGWFRLRLKVDTSLVNQVVGILVNQVIASEIYLDGQRVASFGKVSRNPVEVESCNPSGSPKAPSQIAYFTLGKQTDQVLAVRFAVEPDLVWGYLGTRCLQIRVNKANRMNYGQIESLGYLDLTPVEYFKTGLFLLLALLHLTFYKGYPTQKANLYFGLVCLLSAGYYLLEQPSLQYIHWVPIRIYVNLVTGLFYFISTFLLLVAVNQLFSYQNKRVFRGFLLFGVVAYLLCWLQRELTVLIATLFIIVVYAEITRVAVWAIRQKKEGAGYILFSSLGYAIFLILFLFLSFSRAIESLSIKLIAVNLAYNLGTLCLPIGITLYLAREFVQTTLSLQRNLREVKQLSAEKEQILSSQNETLERQVAERTAELSHKNEELVIEAALERVRSQSMAMQHSDDLQKVITVVSEQLLGLGFEYDYVNFIVVRADRGWDSYNAVPDNDEILSFTIPYVEHKLFILGEEVLQQGLDFFSYTLTLEEKNDWLAHLFNQPIYKLVPDDYKQVLVDLPGLAASVVVSLDLGFSIANYRGVPYTDTENAIFKRFGLVFGQAYTRFKDLKKAEEQAREAKIEAALERVRSRSMAMQHSDDLQSVITVVSEQLQGLGFLFDYVNFVVDVEKRGWYSYIAVLDNSDILGLYVPYADHQIADHRIFNDLQAARKQGLGFYTYTLTFDEKTQWLNHLFNHTDLLNLPEEYKKIVLNFPGMAASVVTWVGISLSIVNYQGIPYTDTENAIFKRFGLVFGQAYTRFKDLRKAEEQAREAIRTTSLDRVRAEIASMRTTRDLDRITPLIWTELTTLQVPFFRCGVFIIHPDRHRIQAFLSTPDGQSRTQLNLAIDQTDNSQRMLTHWLNQQPYTDRWTHQQLQEWAASMVQEGQLDAVQENEVVEEVTDAFSLQFIPFRQGMLYVGSQQPLTERELDLTQSLADAFSVAYARYEDFRQLEEAKLQVDAALTELKATQTQLIQKEKLASLGELTAGIAHEIQNPLNFVNNFSEVSTELVDELKEELAKGDTEEAVFIADDLRQNLEKISHHGGRASAIVRGMLEHSRTSTGEKTPTDLNALADEYLRLAYHGLRAKDKDGSAATADRLRFNAALNTDFDIDLGLVNVVPQELGRVLLNLYNNAFYAVQQRVKQAESDYQPTVWVSTRLSGGTTETELSSAASRATTLLLTVRDNGTGIPNAIREKIFQPFFTTKPTGEGTGLGLSLSYDIITKGHGGTLVVRSEPNQFTEFIITLPFS